MGMGITFRSFAERVRGQLSEEVRVTSRVPRGGGGVLGPLPFLAYENYVWRNMEPTFKTFHRRLCNTVYRKIMNDGDIETLQIDLNGLGMWTVENTLKINAGKSKALSFTRARVKNPLHYFVGDQRILEASCRYSGISYVAILTFWSRNFTFKILAHPVGKMRIIQEPNKVAL